MDLLFTRDVTSVARRGVLIATISVGRGATRR